jgi:hypothetical protein
MEIKYSIAQLERNPLNGCVVNILLGYGFYS